MSARIFVGNLNPRTTEKQLGRFFSTAGVVVSVKLVLDPRTGASRGFGFVEFVERSQAERALLVFQGRELAGRPLRLGWAKEPEERPAGKRAAKSGAGGFGPRAAGWLSDLDDDVGDDYSPRRSEKPRNGKHGSDRRRSRGMRRMIV